ncbi:zona pellucida sperm-binding protein 3 receptor-like [Delphinapterus leucas]|uniref:Zona pellucida sperm-binding protein 3 receptor-like n=1 Tax=Delphinapterus leucas TaxID=9749 RepID=A0A2Y9Q1I2_DELLE|nr:zona pellucida sperm-binding protein 3 receptor-like [Delphinapterus leucas]
MESCLWRRISPETVTIKCDPGYKMVGSQNISCSEKKSRSLDVPKCEKVGTEDCEIVLKGQKLIQCISSPQDSKAFLELHKLSLEIEKLE